MSSVRFEPAGSLNGRLEVPADKSITHRGLLFGAFADGVSRIVGGLDAADTRSSLVAIEGLGAGVVTHESSRGLDVEITGVGLEGASSCSIDVGNSGTLIRLLSGLLAGQPDGDWMLAGDSSIAARPMGRVVDPLISLGAEIETADGGFPPITIHGSDLSGGRCELPVASAQAKSALLLAGLNASAPVEVVEPAPTRDHTELLLARCGVELVRDGLTTTVIPAERLEPLELEVPGDISSAAFALTGALLLPGSEITIGSVGLNPTRTGLLEIFDLMGASSAVERSAPTDTVGEPTGDLTVGSADLQSTEIGGDLIPRAIDELPLVALLGCFANGETVVSGAEELRVKESDRIEGVVTGLSGLGADIQATEDGFRVRGGGGLVGGEIDSRGDHRLAMLGAIAGLVSHEGVDVHGFEAVEVSYPDFESDLRSLIA